MAETRTASDTMADRLLEWGVDTIFGLPGDGINGFMDALRSRHERIRYVHVRHEEVAAMAAVGYAKFTGRLGVCFSTAGPGAVHLMNGLLDAKVEQAPVLAITGMTYHDLVGTSYLQDINIDYMMNDIAVYNQRIMGPQHVINVVDLACRTALTQRGPAHIAFPIDYQAAAADGGTRFQRNVPGHSSARSSRRSGCPNGTSCAVRVRPSTASAESPSSPARELAARARSWSWWPRSWVRRSSRHSSGRTVCPTTARTPRGRSRWWAAAPVKRPLRSATGC